MTELPVTIDELIAVGLTQTKAEEVLIVGTRYGITKKRMLAIAQELIE